MGPLAGRSSANPATAQPPSGAALGQAVPDFTAVYDQNFAYIWRAARRLGIDPADTDDVVQEVFVVAHRKLGTFEGRSQVKTWLFKILLHVVRHHLRALKRKPGHRVAGAHDVDALRAPEGRGPVESAERADAVRVLDRVLEGLTGDQREIFVLAEIEQLSCVQIADVLGANVNTVYSRLRAARQAFERAVARFHTQEFGGRP